MYLVSIIIINFKEGTKGHFQNWDCRDLKSPELELELELKSLELELELELKLFVSSGIGIGIGIENNGIGIGIELKKWNWPQPCFHVTLNSGPAPKCWPQSSTLARPGYPKDLCSGRGRVRTPGLAGISEMPGPNSESHRNNRSFPETLERARVPVKIGSRDTIFGLVNSTYFFK